MNDKGEATVLLSVVGAYATAAPVILAVTTKEVGDGVIWVGAIFAALTAIGIGVGKLFRLLRAASRKLDQIGDLVDRAERMELRQLATSEQLRDLSQRFDTEHPRSP
jgi:hypothetical protein